MSFECKLRILLGRFLLLYTYAALVGKVLILVPKWKQEQYRHSIIAKQT